MAQMVIQRKPEWKEAWKTLKKKRLMEAVFQVCGRQGFTGLTMDNVALQAGVAKGTLYGYFKNKQDLVKCALEASITPLVRELRQLLNSDLPPERKLRQMTLRHLTYFEEHRSFFRMFLYDRQAAQERARRYKSSLYQEFLEATAGVVKDGMNQGVFRQGDCLKVAAMLIEANIAMINRRLVAENPGPVEHDAHLLSDIFLFGIVAEPLRKKRKES